MIKISVIIPVYDAQDYLKSCLDSVINQSLKEIEIICVDDCSADNSLAILEKYRAKDDRIKIIRNERQLNAGFSRNAGMEIATGEYLVFLDADDYLALGGLEFLYNTAKKYDAEYVKTTSLCFTDDDPATFPTSYYSMEPIDEAFFDTVFNIYDSQDALQVIRKIPVAPWSAIFKRAFLSAHNILFNSLICVNDRSFYWGVIIHAKRIVLSHQQIVYHRVSNPNSLIGNRATHFDCHFASFDITENATRELPAQIRNAIFFSELSDMFTWYSRFIEVPGVKEQTKAFLKKISFAEMGEDVFENPWYVPFYKLKYEDYKELMVESPIDYLTRGTDGQIERYRRELEECRENLSASYREIRKFMRDHDQLVSSVSYRLGRLLTFLPRRILRFFRKN
jgi:glycosyltransferase involved in cell wall biosynthesis